MKYFAPIKSFFVSLTRPFPVRDWYIALSCAALVTVIFVGLSVYFFIGIQSGAIIAPTASEQVPSVTISREKLQNIIDQYELRRVNFEAENYIVPDISDPAR